MKKFMNTFAAIAAGFAAAQSASAAVEQPAPAPLAPALQQTGALALSETMSIKNNAGDLFNFVLKRSAETGQLMAWHESHASHASHRSHYSSRY